MPALSTDTVLIPHSHSYQSTYFVNRQDELNIIQRHVNTLQSGRIVKEPLVNFWGVKGLGKTWLLHHLRHLYAYKTPSVDQEKLERPTCALFYTFSDKPEAISLQAVGQGLADETLNQLSTILSENERDTLQRISRSDDIDSLITILRKESHDLVMLILLDNTEKVPSAIWAEIEQYLIEPLISTGRIVMVVAGRRQVPQWRSVEVRRRVMEPHKSRIHPFTKEKVEEQVKTRGYQLPLNLLFPYMAGNPYLVETVAYNVAKWADENGARSDERAWLDAHQASLLAILRSSKEQLLENVSARLQIVLGAIFPLRYYRLEALRYMLTAQDMAADTATDGYFLNLVRELALETEVVWWERERKAYVTSQDVRQLMNRVQLLEDVTKYKALHQHALAMYWQWVRDYPQASEDFIIEIWFHAASLYIADNNRENLHNKVNEALKQADRYLNSDRFMILQNQFNSEKPLEADRELLEVLPVDLKEDLSSKLGKMWKAKLQAESSSR